jgi:tight adherence protein B
MNTGFALFVVVGFVAVVLLLEGLYVYWNDTRSPEVRRLNERLQALSASGPARAVQGQLLRQRVLSENARLQQLLARLPRVQQLDQLMQQSGDRQTVAQLLSVCALVALLGLLVGLLLRWPWWAALGLALGLGGVPLLWLLHKRRQRLQQIETQLPDAMDLMARALRAGHAFPSALNMVGSEAAEPVASEFRITSDEIAFGVSIDNALNHLASRVPSADVRYFAMAVIIQRETGGNLSELLGNLAELVRERFKLFAKVRVLAAEGKLSAYILTGLPFCVAGAIQVMNPEYLSALFTDPAGIRVFYAALAMMASGIFVMWRIINIKV